MSISPASGNDSRAVCSHRRHHSQCGGPTLAAPSTALQLYSSFFYLFHFPLSPLSSSSFASSFASSFHLLPSTGRNWNHSPGTALRLPSSGDIFLFFLSTAIYRWTWKDSPGAALCLPSSDEKLNFTAIPSTARKRNHSAGIGATPATYLDT